MTVKGIIIYKRKGYTIQEIIYIRKKNEVIYLGRGEEGGGEKKATFDHNSIKDAYCIEWYFKPGGGVV